MDIKDVEKKLRSAGLRHRPSQLDMIKSTLSAIEKGQILCVEAPTGTGKTLSYLLASEIAKKTKQKVIISTATIALQEQLIHNDFPLLEKLLDKKIRYAIAKGRQNYLCLAKLNDEQPDFFSDQNTRTYLHNQVNSHFWNGDKETLTVPVNDIDWKNMTTNSVGCSGKHCSYYEECYFFKARNKMHAADYIITNHSLLLADIELGGGVLLPEPEHTIYIIDECHHLPHRSVSHFGKTSKIMSAIDWINPVNFTVQRAIAGNHVPTSWQQKINQCSLNLVTQIKQLKTELDLNAVYFVENIWRITNDTLPALESIQSIAQFSDELYRYCQDIQKILENEAEFISDKTSDHFQQVNKLLIQFKFIISKIDDFFVTWKLFLQTPEKKHPPIARWFEKTPDDYYCHCSPINVSQQLKTLLWDKIENGALLCSATIRSLGSYNNFLRKTGLKLLNDLKTETIPAIFNYQHSVIFIPKMKNEPSGQQQQAHRQEAAGLLNQLILPKSGTLVLFTSKQAMQESLQQIQPDIAGDVLIQGQLNKFKLIENHKKRINQGKRSIIFGLASFAEGIDLPSTYCQHVIIHKLPFAVPSDPIELTRSEWITQHKRNPFLLSTLPETSIKLTQYVGRLIRQEDDIGIVTILDRRLYTKNYGKQLLENLPPFTRLVNESIDTLKQHASTAALFLI